MRSIHLHLEICLQNRSVFHICSKISLHSAKRGGDAFTLAVSCCDGDRPPARGIVSINVLVMLWVWVAGLSGADATAMLIRRLVAAGVSEALTNWDRQSAACFVHLISIWMWCCMWQVLVTINLSCCSHSCHWETSAKVCGYCAQWCQILEIVVLFCYGMIDIIDLLFGSAPFFLSVCECVR